MNRKRPSIRTIGQVHRDGCLIFRVLSADRRGTPPVQTARHQRATGGLSQLPCQPEVDDNRPDAAAVHVPQETGNPCASCNGIVRQSRKNIASTTKDSRESLTISLRRRLSAGRSHTTRRCFIREVSIGCDLPGGFARTSRRQGGNKDKPASSVSPSEPDALAIGIRSMPPVSGEQASGTRCDWLCPVTSVAQRRPVGGRTIVNRASPL